jgi:hypothetical protein
MASTFANRALALAKVASLGGSRFAFLPQHAVRF